MKKFSLLLNLLLASCIAYLYLTRTPSTELVEKNCSRVCLNYSQDSTYELVDGVLLKLMANNYQRTRQIIPSRNYLDAASVWFGLEDLKKFIWQIENSVCKNNCPDTFNLGVRIYYAKYPEIDSANILTYPDLINVPDSFGNMHTVFMVPTFDSLTVPGIHNDFYLDHSFNTDKGCMPAIIPSDGIINPVAVLMAGKNHGTLCPPICGRTAFGQ
jgi:hypothetical protein